MDEKRLLIASAAVAYSPLVRMARYMAWALLGLAACQGLAVGPHEVLLLVNEQSPDSIRIGEAYAALRRIPARNVARVSIAPTPSGIPVEITVEEFFRLIWEPALRAVRERGLERQILAWIYSAGFPTTVAARPPMSLQGLTFLRGVVPDSAAIARGTYVSPLFVGPNNDYTLGYWPQSLDVARDWLGKDMPLPSMALGYTGAGGNSVDDVLDGLRRGVDCDRTAPSGTVYFVTSSDVRSTCRQWQFDMAVNELRSLGVRAVVTNAFPAGKADVLGIMLGAADVNPELVRCYVPGCMAEHLTSAAADFRSQHQTKISAWLRAGATVTAGAVTEPYSIWAKFPHARYYALYALGCTAIESFYQAIRCPLQILLVGDPLAQPWGSRARIELTGLDGTVLGEEVRVRARVECDRTEHYGRILFLVDGIPLSEGPVLSLRPAGLSPGEHAIRAVAYRAGPVRTQVFAERTFLVPGAVRGGREPAVGGLAGKSEAVP